MDDALDAGLGCSTEERARVLDRTGERRGPVVEADPVGVVEDANVGERLAHGYRVVEAERSHLDAALERIRSLRMTGQVPHALAPVDEEAGEVRAAVAEGSRDGVDRAVHGSSDEYAFRIL